MQVWNAHFENMDGCHKSTEKQANKIRELVEGNPSLGSSMDQLIAAMFAGSDDEEELIGDIEYVTEQLKILARNIRAN